MNDTIAATAEVSAAPQGGLYQRLVLDALGKMTAGSLTLEFPDGSKHIIGSPRTAVDAAIASATLHSSSGASFSEILVLVKAMWTAIGTPTALNG